MVRNVVYCLAETASQPVRGLVAAAEAHFVAQSARGCRRPISSPRIELIPTEHGRQTDGTVMSDATEDYSRIADSPGSGWLVGVAGAVVDGDRVLLIRYMHGARKGLWSLPGGYASQTERLDQAVVREIEEETGVTAELVDVIGLRTRSTPQGGGVFVLFRLEPLAGELKPDGDEVDRAEYFSAEQLHAMGDDEILAIARNAGLAALSQRRGLAPDERAPGSGASYRAFLVL